MSDRIKGLAITLEPGMRDDDAAPIIAAIMMLKGVISVVPHIAFPDHHFAVRQAQIELRDRILSALDANP